MIAYPRLLPTQIKFVSQGFGLDGHEARSEGFNRRVHVQVHAGGLNDKHGGVLTTANLSEANHRVMVAFLLSLRGGRTFEVHDMDRDTSSRYTASARTVDDDTITCDADTIKVDIDSLPGVGFVNGDQSGRTLIADNFNNSANLWDAGDALSIGGHIYTSLEDGISDASGNVTVLVDPVLKNVLNNTPIYTRRPHMIARLVTGSISWDTDRSKSGPISFAFEEVI